eukprot:12608636-Prorocentrum_lima.AAC.1
MAHPFADPSCAPQGAAVSFADGLSASAIVPALAEAMGKCFVQCCRTDRPDGLYTTVVCDEMGVALGL